jgi:V8-like Glu-specific endopeptidase
MRERAALLMRTRSNFTRSAVAALVVFFGSAWTTGAFEMPSEKRTVPAREELRPEAKPPQAAAPTADKAGTKKTEMVGNTEPVPTTTPQIKGVGQTQPVDVPPPILQPTNVPPPLSSRIRGSNVQPVPGPQPNNNIPQTQVNNPQLMAPVAPIAPAEPAALAVGIVYGGNDGGSVEICSGTLIDPTHVLTAGHCACGNPSTYRIYPVYSIYPPGFDSIEQGGFRRDDSYPSKAPVMFDPQLCGLGQYRGNDLALLELAENALSVPVMNFGSPLWTLLQQLSKGEKMLVVGYGFDNQNKIGFRNKEAIPIVSVACTERALARYCTPYAEMILAQEAGPAIRNDTCGGDSGGPVFQQIANEGYALVAVTSRSAPGIQDDPGKNCGGGGIYTILGRDSVQQWLKANGVQPAPWLKIGSP